MGTLYLVRHGQASFGAADYDQLSPLGAEQCRLLGAHWRARERRFSAVLTGTLKRHAQSFDALARGMAGPAGELPAPLAMPGLNEYDAEAVIRAYRPGPLAVPTDAEAVREHFRLLRSGLLAWMRGETRPEGMPSYQDFTAGVAEALEHVRTRCEGDVLLVSSGGPIATAVGLVLGTAAETSIDLNLRIRNSAVTEFAFTPKRHSLLSFNQVAHLEREAAQLLTYA